MPDFAPSLPAAPLRLRRPQASIVPRPIVVLIPLLIVFYAFLFLPPETEFSLFGVRLYGYRLGVIVGSIPALWMTIKDSRGFLNRIDIGIALMSFWIVLSFMSHYGLQQGLIRGLGVAIDTGLAYFVARASIVTPNDLRRFLILILPGLMFAAVVMAAESISGRLLLRPLATSIFGNMSSYYGGEVIGQIQLRSELRLGLLRAYGPFDHPILGGTIMTGLLPLYYYSGLRGWPLVLGVVVSLCGLFSLSSAAFLAVTLMIAAIGINRVLPYIPKLSWWTVIAVLTMILTVLHLASTNGLVPVLARMTLSPQTAYYRILIWRYGTASIEKHPLFGVGYGQWERLDWMTESIDAHFLALGIVYGIAVPLALLAAIIFGMIKVGRLMNLVEPQSRKMLVGINMAVFVYLVVGQTVTFYSAGSVVFMTYLGFLASMASWAEYRVKADRQMAMMLRRKALHESRQPVQPERGSFGGGTESLVG